MNLELVLLDFLFAATKREIRVRRARSLMMNNLLHNFETFYWSRVRSPFSGKPRMSRHQ